MQGFLTIQTISPNEKLFFMGNKVKALVEVVGTYHLKFDTIRYLDLPETLYVPSVATYPSAGGRRVTRGMRVPRKEYARSRHQRLFKENVGKNRKRRDLRIF